MPEKSKSPGKEKTKMSTRDTALISILERMADQIQRQDYLLEDIIKYQSDLSKTMQNAEFQRGAAQNETDNANERVRESLSRYRSDMLSLVNEQDQSTKG